MPTAPEAPGNGSSVVQTTTTRRIIPAGPEQDERKLVDFWDYLEKLNPDDWERHPRHVVYIYRMDPRSSNYGDGMSQVDKIEKGYIEMANGLRVPFCDRDEIQGAIREKHGGKGFRLICKRGSERVAEGKCSNDAAPRYATPAPTNGPTISPGSGYGYQDPASNDVAKQAMNIVANKEAEGINLAVNALRASGEMIQRLATPPPAQNTPANDLMNQFMSAMISRMLTPPPDPVELLTRVLTVVHQVTPAAPATSQTGNPVVDKILDAAVERMLNPLPTGPAVSTGAELVRTLPLIASTIQDSVREWHLGSEEQRKTAEIMTKAGQMPQLAGTVPRVPNTVASPTILPPSSAPAAGTPGTVPNNANTNGERSNVNQVSLEYVETMIMKIFSEPISADEAADETIVFLDRNDPTVVNQLAALGEMGLMNLFQTRPVLTRALANIPRLQEFIKSFLKYAQENNNAEPEGSATPPGTAKPN